MGNKGALRSLPTDMVEAVSPEASDGARSTGGCHVDTSKA